MIELHPIKIWVPGQNSYTIKKSILEKSFKLSIKCRSMALCTKLGTGILDTFIIRVANKKYTEDAKKCLYILRKENTVLKL